MAKTLQSKNGFTRRAFQVLNKVCRIVGIMDSISRRRRGEGQGAPNFLKKDTFMLGLCEPLHEKVRGKFLASYEEAMEIVRRKKKKLFLHNNPDGSFMDHEGCPQHYLEESR